MLQKRSLQRAPECAVEYDGRQSVEFGGGFGLPTDQGDHFQAGFPENVLHSARWQKAAFN